MNGESILNLISDQNLLSVKVVDISWERINLYIDIKIDFSENVDKNIPLDFYAVNGKFLAKAKFKVSILENGNYRLYLNITNPGYNRCLSRGNYYISVCQGDNELAHCMTDESIVKKMNDFSRSFLYGNRGKVYSVVFYVDDSDDSALLFRMYTMASSAISVGNLNPISLAPTEKVNNPFVKKIFKKLKKKIKKPFSKGNARKIIRRIYKFLVAIHHSSKNTILFMSEQNPLITANQEAVYNRMIERGLDKDFTILTSFRSAAAEKQSVFSWLSLLNKLAKSTMVIIDDHAPIFDWMMLNKKTKVVQLWHAGAGFKSSGYSRWGNKGCPSTFSCHRQYSYGIAGSKNIAHFFSEVWGINTEQVLPTGMPRMDEYLDENYKSKTVEKLYEQYPLCKGKKVILFAPTYRGKNKANAYYPYELIDFEKFYNLCSDEYVVLFKMHPWVSDSVPIPDEYQDKFVDVGLYPNINDLFYITDLLITDYSSNIFEYSLMKNPMLFFAFDEIQYSFSRGFHRDYELSAPGKIVHTFDELLTAIENKDFEVEKVQNYVDVHFDYIDSNASDRVIDWIILGNIPTEMQKAIDDRFEEVKHMAQLDFTPELEEEV
jgi:CDP-ribitol ribitolphosphotransferase